MGGSHSAQKMGQSLFGSDDRVVWSLARALRPVPLPGIRRSGYIAAMLRCAVCCSRRIAFASGVQFRPRDASGAITELPQAPLSMHFVQQGVR